MDKFKSILESGHIDMSGPASIDFRGGKPQLHRMAEELGIDTELNFPVGFSYVRSTLPGNEGVCPLQMIILTLKTSEYGQDYEEVAKAVQNRNGIVSLDKHLVTIGYDQLDKYLKRVEVFVLSEIQEHMKRINLNDWDEEE